MISTGEPRLFGLIKTGSNPDLAKFLNLIIIYYRFEAYLNYW